MRWPLTRRPPCGGGARFAATTVALLASSAAWLTLPHGPTALVATSARETALATAKITAATDGAASRGYEIISDAGLMSCLQDLQDQSAIIFPDADGRAEVVLLIGG